MAETAVDFAEVYNQYLPRVWRYTRARVPDHHEAEDVASEVFVRAWQSWLRYNASQGSVAPWLFRIAQRTVADWYRGRFATRVRREVPLPHAGTEPTEARRPLEDPPPSPEDYVLEREQVTALQGALGMLREREREILALRFAAELRVAEIGQIVGLSAAATQMVLYRAIMRLREILTQQPVVAADEGQAVLSLDGLVDGILARRPDIELGAELRPTVVQLASLYQPEVPPDLKTRVRACLACYGGAVSRERSLRGALSSFWARIGLPATPGVSFLLVGPACLMCTLPAVWDTLLVMGVLGTAMWLHDITVVVAPVATLLLWRSYRRHRRPAGLWLATAGSLLIVLHFLYHLTVGLTPGEAVFDLTNRAGLALLWAGILVSLVSHARWLSSQRSLLLRLLPAERAT
ncbi:MAG: sigma-70 family RNA polymerase sigma factor [Chloroflexi bacterium]|nr:sigma-70 family RNA polymerase sigma factor [Chloroflexota bacterium]